MTDQVLQPIQATEHPTTHSSLCHMLEARSVAVVGASGREGSYGYNVLAQLDRKRFGNHIYPVNPRYNELLGYRCYPSISDLPESVDRQGTPPRRTAHRR